MMVLIRNEIKKLLKRKKTLVVLIVFAALIALICYASYKEAYNFRLYNSPASRKANLEEQINNYKKAAEDTGLSQEEKDKINNEIAIMKDELAKIDASSVQNNNWKEDLKKEVDDLKESLKNSNQALSDAQGKDRELLRTQIITDEYLIDHNIRPSDYGDFNAAKYVKNLLIALGAVFLIVGIMIFAADMVSGEFTPPTMKVLLTQPVSRAKILLSKFIAAVIASIILIICLELISFLIMGLIFGFGNSLYPVVAGTKYRIIASNENSMGRQLVGVYGSSYIIPMWQYLVRIFLFETLFIIACTSFAFLISTLFKSSMVSVASGTVIAIALIIFQNMQPFPKLVPYLITTYGNFDGIVSGSIAQNINNTMVTPMLSCIVLVGWTVVCYIIAHVIFIKRDVLI